MLASRMTRLATVGTAAGLFSGLFGVGGGTILVPLLVLWLGFGQRQAAATSLAAIIIIASVAAAAQGLAGNVDLGTGLVLGVGSAIGALAGASLQQRVRQRHIGLAFAALLVAAAVQLLVSG